MSGVMLCTEQTEDFTFAVTTQQESRCESVGLIK